MAKMKAAVIGCGNMGHMQARAAQLAGLEVVAFCDIKPEAAQQACDKFGGRYATTDADRIMRDDSIELLMMPTHSLAHHRLGIAGARAGKHMLLEKPLCLTWQEAVEVAEAVEKAGVKVVIDHKFRASPAVQKAKELIPNPRLSHGQLAMQQTYHHRIWSKIDGVDEGGLLTNTACHTVDLLTYLMDSDPDRVYAEGRLFEPETKSTVAGPDALVGTILWKNGSLSTVISCDQGFNPFVSKWFHEIWDGERSAVFTEHTGRVDFGGCEVDCVDVGAPTGDERLRVLGPYPMLMSLLEAIRTDGETLCTVRDGVRTVIICNALQEAVRTGRPQSL